MAQHPNRHRQKPRALKAPRLPEEGWLKAGVVGDDGVVGVATGFLDFAQLNRTTRRVDDFILNNSDLTDEDRYKIKGTLSDW